MVQVNAKGGFAPAEAYAIHRERLKRDGAGVDPNHPRAHRARRAPSWRPTTSTWRRRARRLVRAMDARHGDARCAGAADDADRRAEDRRGRRARKISAARTRCCCATPTPVNFFDLCAISLPLPRQDGLSTGLMLVGRNGQDRRLFDIAAAVEKAAQRLTKGCRPAACLCGAAPLYHERQSQSGGVSHVRISHTHRPHSTAAACWPALPPSRPCSRPRRSSAPRAAALKVGVLLPRSGAQAGIGQDCFTRRRAGEPDLQEHRPARARDHERRHRDQRRGRALARREADRRRRAASGRRLRFRAEQRDRPGRRAEGHSLRHQHRRGAADHRAGLQVRVPQFPDRGHDPRRRLRQPEGGLRGKPARSRSRWCSCTSTTPSARR